MQYYHQQVVITFSSVRGHMLQGNVINGSRNEGKGLSDAVYEILPHTNCDLIQGGTYHEHYILNVIIWGLAVGVVYLLLLYVSSNRFIQTERLKN